MPSSGQIKYEFSAKTWQHSPLDTNGSWCFVAIPKKMSKEIRTLFQSEEEGWGRLKVVAKIGNSEWKTAIWFDTKMDTYLLPLKAEIRKKEQVIIDNIVNIIIWI
jgi:hypothetical protein